MHNYLRAELKLQNEEYQMRIEVMEGSKKKGDLKKGKVKMQRLSLDCFESEADKNRDENINTLNANF